MPSCFWQPVRLSWTLFWATHFGRATKEDNFNGPKSVAHVTTGKPFRKANLPKSNPNQKNNFPTPPKTPPKPPNIPPSPPHHPPQHPPQHPPKPTAPNPNFRRRQAPGLCFPIRHSGGFLKPSGDAPRGEAGGGRSCDQGTKSRQNWAENRIGCWEKNRLALSGKIGWKTWLRGKTRRLGGKPAGKRVRRPG